MVGVGMRLPVERAEVSEEADSAAPVERGGFRADRTMASSLPGSLASSSVVWDFGHGGGGDSDKDEFFPLQRSLGKSRRWFERVT